MPIQITCPGCHKRFKVSDKFAGKTGPCPQCKTQIEIPATSDEIVVHAPEHSGPTDSKGRAVLKPIERKETKFNPIVAGAIGGGVVVLLIVAVVLRFVEGGPPTILLGFGTLLLGPPLAVAAYTFLRDAELEPYMGRALWIRAGICGVVYALLWGIYAFVPWYLELAEDGIPILYLVIFGLLAFGIGAFTSHASLDLELGSGAIHFGFYLIVTLILCFVMGVNLTQFSTSAPATPPPSAEAVPSGTQESPAP